MRVSFILNVEFPLKVDIMLGPMLGKSVAFGIWAFTMFSVLQLHKAWPEHYVCGTWGCGPTIGALSACHGFWSVLLVPMAFVAARRRSPRTTRRIGYVLAAAAVVVAAAIFGIEAVRWSRTVVPGFQQYAVQRGFFMLITQVDVPVIGIFLSGLGLIAASFFKRRPAIRMATALESVASDEFG